MYKVPITKPKTTMKSFIFCKILIFLFVAKAAQKESSSVTRNIIFDISKLVNISKDSVKSVSKILDGYINSANQTRERQNDSLNTLYYEIEPKIEAQKQFQNLIDTILDFRRNSSSPPKLMLSIKSCQKESNTSSLTQHLITNLLTLVVNHASLFFGVMFDVSCIGNDRHNDNIIVQHAQNISMDFKNLMRSKGTQDSSKKPMKIGYVVDYKSVNCKEIAGILKEVDFIVINIPFGTNGNVFIESYGIFTQTIDTIVQNISNSGTLSIHKTKNLGQLYYRISLHQQANREELGLGVCRRKWDVFNGKVICSKDATLRAAVTQVQGRSIYRYEHLFSKYLVEWVRNINDSIIIANVMDFDFLGRPSSGRNQIDSLPARIPYITTNKLNWSDDSTMMMLRDASISGFKTIMVDEHIRKMINERGNSFNFTIIIDNPQNLSLPPAIRMETEGMRILHNKDELLAEVLFAYHKYETNNIPSLNYVSKSSYRENRGTEIHPTQSQCDDNCVLGYLPEQYGTCKFCFAFQIFSVEGNALKNNVTGLVWKGTIMITKNNLELPVFVDRIMKRLEIFVMARQILHADYPDRQIILEIESDIFTTEPQISVYCDPIKEKISQLFDAILTWADVHEFPVIMKVYNDTNGFGNPFTWEKLIITDENMSKLKAVMEIHPLFMQRRYNPYKTFRSWGEGAYPCISRTINISNGVDTDFGNHLIGTTLDLKVRRDWDTFNAKEVTVLLLFTLKKFRNIHIHFVAGKELKLLGKAVLNNNFEAQLKLNGIEGNSFYLQIQKLTKKEEQQLLHISSVLTNSRFNVHILHTAIDEDGIGKASKKFDGFVHPNCDDLANQMISGIYDSVNVGIINKTSYLICDTKVVTANNTNQVGMQNLMNSHLYMDKLFRHLFPNILSVHFRLSYTSTKDISNETSHMLMFLSDLIKHSKTFGIHYFLLPAFVDEEEVSLRSIRPSFWRIAEYTKLDDTSVYRNIQGDVFNTAIWTPKLAPISDTLKPMPETEGQGSQASLMITTGALVGIIVTSVLVIIIFLAVLFKIRYGRWHLSDKEIEEFLEGHRETLETAADHRKHDKPFFGNIFDGLMYQQEYELSNIPENVHLNNIIGEGKYSTVYRAKLDGSEDFVAIKIPKKNCSKAIFKGFLSEIKLLCYIGEYPHLVRFIGCNTQEMQNRVLMIVIEYYPKGSLLDYVKGLKLLKSDEWSVQQLIRFTTEIACGMEYISGQNAIHGGLCAKHVLLSDNLTCKIGGFSLSRKLPEYQSFVKSNHFEKLPWQWMAMESLRKLEFSKQSDVWSYGVTVWEIFSLGDVPYPGVELTTRFINDLERGMRMESPTFATKEIFDVMLKCWERLPEDRISFSKLVEHFTGKLPDRMTKDLTASLGYLENDVILHE